MSAKNHSAIPDWARVEAEICAGSPTQGSHPSLEVFHARSTEFNYRKAEALSLAESVDRLQKLRTSISRGYINEVKKQIREILAATPELKASPEWALEVARLYAFGGDWQECVAECTRLLELSPTSVTRLTATQVRSIAYYEMGDWSLCRRDLETIRSLGAIYPRATAHFYAEVLAVKIQAIENPALARKQLAKLWKKSLQKEKLNPDTALTLLRTAAHVDFCAGTPTAPRLLACHALAEHIGDDQYTALARLELLFCANGTELEERVREDRGAFPRIDRWLREIESGRPVSTTAKTLLRSRPVNSPLAVDLKQEVKYIVSPEQGLLIRLDPFEVAWIRNPTRLFDALVVIGRADGSIAKADLFEALYGQKYAPHLHEPLIYKLCSRLRKQWLVELAVREGQIEIENLLCTD